MDVYPWGLIAKYVAGEASEREREVLEAWVDSDPSRHDLLDDAVQAWEAARKDEAVRTNATAAWDTLAHRIEEDEAGSKPPARTPPRNRPGRSSKSSMSSTGRRLRRAVGGVAIILVAVFAVLLWRESPDEVIYVERGERSTVELADGTRVHLNADSELTLVAVSGRGAREVRLEGEAYFEVAHDERRPFLVHTTEGTVRVVGTAFNVEAYADERRTQVAVEGGAVALHVDKATQAAHADTVVLRARHLGVMVDQRLRALHRNMDLAPHVAWKEGRLVFEDAPFSEVVRRLERWYDLDIKVHPQLGTVDRLNAVFDQESPGEVISDITLALDLEYERDGATITFYRGTSPSSGRALLEDD